MQQPKPVKMSVPNKTVLLAGAFLLGCGISAILCIQMAVSINNPESPNDLVVMLAGVALWEPDPSLRDVTNHLNTDFPIGATDIQLDANLGRNYHIDLAFKAPPSSVERFLTGICDDQLLQGFDPFNAKYDKSDQAVNRFNLSLLSDQVYGYSLETPDIYFGNVCWGKNYKLYMILVDKTHPDLYNVKFQSPNTCPAAKPPVPCPRGSHP